MSETFRERSPADGTADGVREGTRREGLESTVSAGGTAREGSGMGGNAGGGAGPQAYAAGFVRAALLPCLSDRFGVVRDLGAGGESDVLLVADAGGDQWVVKQYRQQGWSPSLDVLDLLEDLKVGQTRESWAADLRTRHVVWLQEWGTDPSTGLFYEVQEYVAGGTLASGEGSGFTDAVTVHGLGEWPAGVFAQALIQAVAGFHRTVGAHRDLKPANLLVRSADPLVLVVADVGLSRNVGESSHRFSKRDGSPAYQAPEAGAHGKVSRAGDWWSVGVMVAEACSGRHPLSSRDGLIPDDRVLQAALVEREMPLDGVTDPRLLLLCQGLLTRDSERRWRLPQITAWLEGESPPTGYQGTSASSEWGPADTRGPVRTVLFAGADFDSPQGLAAAFAAAPERAGRLLFEQKDPVLLEDLRLLLQSRGLYEAQSLLDGQRSGAWQPTFLRLLEEMDPQLTPELAGLSMTPDAVARAARTFIGDSALSELPEWLLWITDHELWRLWRRLPGMTDSANAAERLQHFSVPESIVLCVKDGQPEWVAVAQAAGRHVLVDDSARATFWRARQPVAEAWMLLWAVEPEEASRTMKSELASLRRGADVTDQTWWKELAETVPNALEVAKMHKAVGALVSYPLAVLAQDELAAWRDAQSARRQQDLEKVRASLIDQLDRQGEAYLKLRRTELRAMLKKASRASIRGPRAERLQRVWKDLLRLRQALDGRYGMQFDPQLSGQAFAQAPNPSEFLLRELERNPTRREWRDWDRVSWTPPSPILIAVVTSLPGVVMLVDPIVGEIVTPLDVDDDAAIAFARSASGRVLVGTSAFPDFSTEEDVAVGPISDPRAVQGPTGSDLIVKLANRRIEVVRAGGQVVSTFSTSSPAPDAELLSMPDGELAIVTLSQGSIQIWHLTSGHEMPVQIPSIDASGIVAPPTGGVW